MHAQSLYFITLVNTSSILCWRYSVIQDKCDLICSPPSPQCDGFSCTEPYDGCRMVPYSMPEPYKNNKMNTAMQSIETQTQSESGIKNCLYSVMAAICHNREAHFT